MMPLLLCRLHKASCLLSPSRRHDGSSSMLRLSRLLLSRRPLPPRRFSEAETRHHVKPRLAFSQTDPVAEELRSRASERRRGSDRLKDDYNWISTANFMSRRGGESAPGSPELLMILRGGPGVGYRQNLTRFWSEPERQVCCPEIWSMCTGDFC